MSQILQILKTLEVERCDECRCAVGSDWQFVDFSNHNLIACPQCGEQVEVATA